MTPGPLGAAYRDVRKKYVLHLAMLLHDLGKGYDEDHSLVGRAIADRMADRLRIADEDRETLVYLVYRHLAMAHQAFRRDNSEYEGILDFSREVGSAERLRMLFVLTAADVTAVGPGVWTQWKSQLVTELYERTLVLLGGQDAAADQARRLGEIKRRVMQLFFVAGFTRPRGERRNEDPRPLGNAPRDITSPRRPSSGSRSTSARSSTTAPVKSRSKVISTPPTQTVDYGIITHENDVQGCFHKATGVLTAHRLAIVSAEICTTPDGFVIDSFRVHDRDFAGAVPSGRIDEVAAAMENTLSGRVRVEELFQRNRRFGGGPNSSPFPTFPPAS